MHASARPLRAPPRRARPLPTGEGVALRRIRATALCASGQLVECTGCGSRALTTRPPQRCALCGSTRVESRTGAGRVVAPQGLLPFGLDRDQARAALHRWASSRWLAPRGLAARLAERAPDDVYLPYWRFDSEATAHYRGQRGEDRWEPDGRAQRWLRRTPRSSRTRWRAVGGVVQRRFDGLLLCASRSLPPALLERLPPWDLRALVPYQPQQADSTWTERYGVEPPEAIRMARARMDRALRQVIRANIGGDRQRIHDMQVAHARAQVAHVLRPLWIHTHRHRDRLYRVLVDGRTGAVVGEHPRSLAKVAGVVLLALAGLALVLGALGGG